MPGEKNGTLDKVVYCLLLVDSYNVRYKVKFCFEVIATT